MTAIRTNSWSAPALLTAAAAGVTAGGLTAYLQGILSADWNTVANSGAVWTLVAAAVAGLVGRQRAIAVSVGMLVLVGEVVGYYAYVSDVLHLPVLQAEEALWTVAALWIGPLAGLAAFAIRWGSPQHRVLALLTFCGVVGGEGAYLWRLAEVPAAGIAELAAAGVGAAAVMIAVPAAVGARVLAAVGGIAVAVGVYLAYAQPVIA
jgi:hypothetical protein